MEAREETVCESKTGSAPLNNSVLQLLSHSAAHTCVYRVQFVPRVNILKSPTTSPYLIIASIQVVWAQDNVGPLSWFLRCSQSVNSLSGITA